MHAENLTPCLLSDQHPPLLTEHRPGPTAVNKDFNSYAQEFLLYLISSRLVIGGVSDVLSQNLSILKSNKREVTYLHTMRIHLLETGCPLLGGTHKLFP